MRRLLRKLFSTFVYSLKDIKIVQKLASNSIGIHSTRIEINGACNAKCTFCHTGAIHYNKNKHMPPELFKKILTHLQNQKLLTKYIWLYDRGEPFLHPQIGEILDICRSFKIKTRISSTATKVPKLSRKQWQTISMFKLSTSGITQSSYGRIHGLNVETIKKNAEIISKLLSPFCYAQVSWHRYQFNLEEELDARIWSKKLGFIFDAIDAEVIEVEKLVDIANNTVSQQIMDEIQSLLLVDRSPLLSRLINKEKVSPTVHINKNFICTQFDQIAVNYDGQLLKCCGLSPEFEENRLGNVLNLERKRIKEKNYANCNICGECIKSGIAYPSDENHARIWNKK